MLRICNKCGINKPLEEFNRDKRMPEGRNVQCKQCRSEYFKTLKLYGPKPHWKYNFPDCLEDIENGKVKYCSSCDKLLPAEMFSLSKSKNLRKDRCRDCKQKYHKDYYSKNKDHYHETQKQWIRQDRIANPEKHLLRSHKKHSMEHGHTSPDITIEDLKILKLTAQNKCQSCFSICDDLYLEHNHKTGLVRGLTCPGCNITIGRIEHENFITTLEFLIKTDFEYQKSKLLELKLLLEKYL